MSKNSRSLKRTTVRVNLKNSGLPLIKFKSICIKVFFLMLGDCSLIGGRDWACKRLLLNQLKIRIIVGKNDQNYLN